MNEFVAMRATEQIGPSRSLAAFAAGLRFEDIPRNVIDRALIHMIDGLGIAVASTTFPFAGPTLAAVDVLSGGGPATIIGSAKGAAPRDAAMANGVLIHGLDYDDTHLQSIVHATVAVLPAVLAVAEARGSSGAEVLTAFCMGMEAAVRMGAAVKGGFHHTGFHATGVLAHFSSALAAGRLSGASADQHVHALGIAASTASGIQVFLEEGAWTKRLHPGWAAAGGMTAAALALAGFRGPTRAFEGKFGLFETHLHVWAKDVDTGFLTGGLGQRWMMEDTALKPYPACHFIHGAADAALDLRDEVAGAEIEAVEIFLPQDTLKIVAEPIESKCNPRNEYDAKFSAPFVVASTLLKGRFGLADLTDEALADPATRALARKCSCSADPDTLFPEYFSGGVRLRLTDGRERSRHVLVNSGAGARRMSLEQTTEKFLQNTRLAIDDAKALAIRSAVLDLAEGGIAPLVLALRG